MSTGRKILSPAKRGTLRARDVRKAIAELPTAIGTVTSDKPNKTRRVAIERLVRHERYGKYVRRRTTCFAHDEQNESHVGDVVEIMENRPVSKTKTWRIVRVITKREAPVKAVELGEARIGVASK